MPKSKQKDKPVKPATFAAGDKFEDVPMFDFDETSGSWTLD